MKYMLLILVALVCMGCEFIVATTPDNHIAIDRPLINITAWTFGDDFYREMYPNVYWIEFSDANPYWGVYDILTQKVYITKELQIGTGTFAYVYFHEIAHHYQHTILDRTDPPVRTTSDMLIVPQDVSIQAPLETEAHIIAKYCLYKWSDLTKIDVDRRDQDRVVEYIKQHTTLQ